MNVINTKQNSWQEEHAPSKWVGSPWRTKHDFANQPDSVNIILFRLILVGVCFFSAISGHLVFALCGLPAYFFAMRIYTVLPHEKGPLVAFLCGSTAGLLGGGIGFFFYNLLIHPTLGAAAIAAFIASLVLISYLVFDH